MHIRILRGGTNEADVTLEAQIHVRVAIHVVMEMVERENGGAQIRVSLSWWS
jgi:hypothetical protein